MKKRLLAPLLTLCTLVVFFSAGIARAQEDEPEPPPEPDTPPVGVEPGTDPGPVVTRAPTGTSPLAVPADFTGTLQVVRGPASAAGPTAPGGGPEIFPDSSRVWMSVRDIDPLPIETARRGGKWLCSGGGCSAQPGSPGRSAVGDQILRSIKLQTPALPLPLTIWGRQDEHGERLLDFDPVLLGRRSYRHVCAYRPVTQDTAGPADAKPPPPDKVGACRDGSPDMPAPDAGELTLGMQWPKLSEMADFHYLAIVDSCGNARVQPFQRTFTVPVFEVASGGCGRPDGKVLRIFPSGGWIRVTAFNLRSTTAGNVVNATYRVTVPALENLVESNPARLLFPDPLTEDLKVDCGPTPQRVRTDPLGIPGRPPGAAPPSAASLPEPDAPARPQPDQGPSQGSPGTPQGAPKSPQGAPETPQGGPRTPQGALRPPRDGNPAPWGTSPAPPPSAMPPRARPDDADASRPGPQPLAHGSVVISPGPLRLGNCKVRLTGQTKRRLVAPLALHVSLTRTDQTVNGTPIELLTDGKWIVTPGNAEFQLPPLAENFDGDSRLRLVVHSDPLSPEGKVVLLSDAGRLASALRSNEPGEPERARRLVGSVTIHSVPLCGAANFETIEAAGRCLRAYLTIPAMLATIQVTRAPWVEKPLVTRTVLSAVGVALAIDSYDPVERRAFPIAAQLGGFVQTLGEGRVGMLGYLGIAPTIPILGTGGNTTSFGFLAGIGLEYITNEAGPDEGLKPAAFLSAVVQVGQATPQASLNGRASFGTYAGE